MLNLRNSVYTHILSEILVVCCLVLWMSSYRKRTTAQIEKLLLRIEEQDEKIQKLEQLILHQQQQQQVMNAFIPNPIIKPVVPPKPVVHVVPTPQKSEPTPSVEPLHIPTVAETKQDLDQLLKEELAELEQSEQSEQSKIEEISTEDLKKKSP